MRSVKKWDIDWDAAAALIDFAKLDCEEMAVTMQIINLSYAQNRLIDNNPGEIKTYIREMSRARCERVIHRLIHRGTFSVENGKLFQKNLAEKLENREKSYRKSQIFGKIGGETKAENEQKQGEKPSPPSKSFPPSLPSSPSSLKTSLPSVTARGIGRGSFSIWDEMTTKGEAEARRAAPDWDIRKLAGTFDEKVKSGEFQAPGDPDSAFPAWCKKYTKGKPPR